MMVSVVMPVYNGEIYLKEAIDSILNQTYKDFEFIIVNDGSTDGTATILKQISDSRVNIIHLSKNVGVARARNIGVTAAQGKWIAVQDSDDISHPNRLVKQLEHINIHPDTIAVGSQIKCISGRFSNERDHEEYLKSTEKWSNALITREQIKDHRFISTPVINGSVLFLKEAFQKIGGYNNNYKIGEDFDLWIKLLNYGPIDKIPEILYFYRVDAGSLSHENDLNTCSYLIKIACGHIRELLVNQLQQEPTFLVIGTENGCNYVTSNVVPETNINVYKYIHYDIEKHLQQIYFLFRKKKVNGIIILDCDNYWNYLSYFENRGLVMNQNLFRLWNVF